MKIANKENVFKKEAAKKVNVENLELISFVESIAEERLLLDRNKKSYDYEYLAIDFEEFAQSLKESFEEKFNKRVYEINHATMTKNFWVKEIKELLKIRKVFLKNMLTN